MTSLPAKILIAPIRFYQRFITPYTPASCRYYPTCSAYAVTALRSRGAVVGTGLTVWRLLRCNPWSDGGIDHVPARGQRRQSTQEALTHEHRPADDLGTGEFGSAGGERGESARSFPSAGAAGDAAAVPDLDAPQSAAAGPMTGRSAA